MPTVACTAGVETLSCPAGVVSPLVLDALPAPPHATVRVVRQSSSERKQRFMAKALFAMQLLAVPGWVLRIDEHLGTELGGPSFESLGSTVEIGGWEGQITWEQGLSGPGSTSPTDDALPGLNPQDLKFQGVIRSVGSDLFTPVWTSGVDAFSIKERRPYFRERAVYQEATEERIPVIATQRRTSQRGDKPPALSTKVAPTATSIRS
jgi:hypothetical protein